MPARWPPISPGPHLTSTTYQNTPRNSRRPPRAGAPTPQHEAPRLAPALAPRRPDAATYLSPAAASSGRLRGLLPGARARQNCQLIARAAVPVVPPFLPPAARGRRCCCCRCCWSQRASRRHRPPEDVANRLEIPRRRPQAQPGRCCRPGRPWCPAGRRPGPSHPRALSVYSVSGQLGADEPRRPGECGPRTRGSGPPGPARGLASTARLAVARAAYIIPSGPSVLVATDRSDCAFADSEAWMRAVLPDGEVLRDQVRAQLRGQVSCGVSAGEQRGWTQEWLLDAGSSFS